MFNSTDDVLARDRDILEHHATGAPAPAAHQTVDIIHADARPALYDKAGQGLVRLGLRIGFGVNQKIVRAFRAYDKSLLAIEQKVVAFVLGRGGRAEKVGAAARLGQTFGREDVAAQQRFDIFFLLRVRAMQNNGIADQFGAHAEGAGEDVAEGADFLHYHAGRYPIHVPAAPLFRIAAAEQVAAARLLQKLPGKLDFILVHIQDHLPGHPAHQVAGFLAQLLLRIGHQIIEH